MPRISAKRRIQDLPMRFLKCRAFGHDWDDPPPLSVSEATRAGYINGVRFRFRCASCTGHKEVVMTYGGKLILTRYIPPKGYRVVGLGSSRQPFRLEYLERKGMTKPGTKQPARRPAARQQRHLRSVA